MIEITRITNKQKLIISKGLLDYEYIMNHWMDNDSDFKDVYYEFYLKARAPLRAPTNRIPYFEKLQSISPNDDLIDIIMDLSTSYGGALDFSICSKMLHTKNPNVPIYDSKVRDYLRSLGVGLHVGKNTRETITSDWTLLCNWYSDFIASDVGVSWIEWFDVNFPSYTNISLHKKVDFIIFACN